MVLLFIVAMNIDMSNQKGELIIHIFITNIQITKPLNYRIKINKFSNFDTDKMHKIVVK